MLPCPSMQGPLSVSQMIDIGRAASVNSQPCYRPLWASAVMGRSLSWFSNALGEDVPFSRNLPLGAVAVAIRAT